MPSESVNLSELNTVVAEVQRRSAVDSDFRALALQDAHAAIAKVSKIKLPADMSFKFIDNSGSLKTISLPDPSSSFDLSEVDLEQVAGGTGIRPAVITVSWGR